MPVLKKNVAAADEFPSSAWREYSKRLTNKNYLPGLEEIEYFIRGTAGECRQLLEKPNNRTQVDNIIHTYRSVLKRVTVLPLKKADPLTRAILTWRLAHFEVHALNYEIARDGYLSALETLDTNPELWLDYGRLEYNTGNVKQAYEAFERAFMLREDLAQNREQTWRWVAKAGLAFGKVDRAVEIMLQLLRLTERRPGAVDAVSSKDRSESLKYLRANLIGALIRTNAYEQAVNVARALFSSDMDMSGKSSFISAIVGIAECMVKLHQQDDARKFAGHFAEQLGEPIIRYCVEHKLNRGFSSRVAYFGAIDKQSATDPTIPKLVFGPDNTISFSTANTLGLTYLAEANKCYSLGLFGLGGECISRAAQECLQAGDSETLANCLDVLDFQSRFRAMSDAEILLQQEISDTSPTDPLLLLQLGRGNLRRKNFQAAQRFLESARATAPQELAPWLHTMLGAAMCGLGQAEIGASLIEEALPNASEGEVPVFAYREAVHAAFEAGLWQLALRWSQRFFRSFVYLERNSWAVDIAEKGGRSALLLGSFGDAKYLFQHMTRACAAHMGEFVLRSEGLIGFQQFVQANQLWALSAVLSGDSKTAKSRLEQIPTAEVESKEYIAVRCLLDVEEGRHEKALETLYGINDAPWLFKPICDYLLTKKDSLSLSESHCLVLRRWSEDAANGDPKRDTMAERLARYQLDAVYMSQLAAMFQRSHDAIRHALLTVTSTLSLPDELLVLRRRLFASETGGMVADVQELDQFVSQVVDTLKRDVDYSTMCQRYTDQLSAPAMKRLDVAVINRLEAASFYVNKSRGTFDSGPAILSLASSLERVVRDNIVQPLHAYMVQTNSRLAGVIKKSPFLREVTLGRFSYVLGQSDWGNNVEPEYRALKEKWLVEKLAADKREYYVTNLVRITHQVSGIRNTWAHGGASLNSDDLANVESLLFPSDGISVFERIVL